MFQQSNFGTLVFRIDFATNYGREEQKMDAWISSPLNHFNMHIYIWSSDTQTSVLNQWRAPTGLFQSGNYFILVFNQHTCKTHTSLKWQSSSDEINLDWVPTDGSCCPSVSSHAGPAGFHKSDTNPTYNSLIYKSTTTHKNMFFLSHLKFIRWNINFLQSPFPQWLNVQ